MAPLSRLGVDLNFSHSMGHESLESLRRGQDPVQRDHGIRPENALLGLDLVNLHDSVRETNAHDTGG